MFANGKKIKLLSILSLEQAAHVSANERNREQQWRLIVFKD